MSLELGTRQGWPAELLFLRARYPRDSWPGNRALGELAHFWLAKHAALAELGAQLSHAGDAWRAGQLPSVQFRSASVPILGRFLGDLQGHHQVEDQHYFPHFRTIEPRLARGFDVLERDHNIIHAQIEAAVEAARTLLRQNETDLAAFSDATERHIDATAALVASLGSHLTDEEDLVIPLIAGHLRG